MNLNITPATLNLAIEAVSKAYTLSINAYEKEYNRPLPRVGETLFAAHTAKELALQKEMRTLREALEELYKARAAVADSGEYDPTVWQSPMSKSEHNQL